MTPFRSPLQQIQYISKYARYNHALGRRETWGETVERAVAFLGELSSHALPEETYQRIHDAIYNLEVMPSMRLLAMAGPAARRNHASIYNCAFVAVDSLDAFVEALLLSMAGCGVGFSVEQQFVGQLPTVRHQSGFCDTYWGIDDSTEGWGEALRTGLRLWFHGSDIQFDYSHIRPAGSPLMTKGGQASGPEPLREMLDFVRGVILSRQGRKLRPIDAHHIMTKIGDAAVCGGMRRTAQISLFDWGDDEMRHCKDGEFWRHSPHLSNANNSAVMPGNISREEFEAHFMAMDAGKTGEPGLFSREVIERLKPVRRESAMWGANPCNEIALRSQQLCNLSVAVARPWDTWEALRDKVGLATIIGTIQSMASHLPGLRPQWIKNCEEERLLGVDITGQMDCHLLSAVWGETDITPAGGLNALTARMNAQDSLTYLRGWAIATNFIHADKLGIAPSAAITCVKPSGNSSVLLDCAPGIHPRHAPLYIRRMRFSPTDPVFLLLADRGVPHVQASATEMVVEVPVASPPGAMTKAELGAMGQYEVWRRNRLYYTEHSPSCTIAYGPRELPALIDRLWEDREILSGLSFYPADDAVYPLAPYEAIGAGRYRELAAAFPVLDFAALPLYETTDMSRAGGEVACVGGACEI